MCKYCKEKKGGSDEESYDDYEVSELLAACQEKDKLIATLRHELQQRKDTLVLCRREIERLRALLSNTPNARWELQQRAEIAQDSGARCDAFSFTPA